jgi:GR25 family glycosyltransferase involved in LPS biosynthesis
MSHNIDKIIYINLNKRIDRREEIESELNNFGLEYERFEAIETPSHGILGCGKSHLSVLKLAKERNYKNILILEDDFMFLVSKEEFEKNLSDFFSLNLPFDVCMLSYNLIKSEQLENNVVNKVIEVQTASGYIVNNHYYDKLIQLYEWALPLLEQTGQHWIYANDQIWKQCQPNDNWFYFKTRLGKQRLSYSDNTEKFEDYLDC